MNPEIRGEWSKEVPPELTTEFDGKLFDRLYKATMENKWDQVVNILDENQIDHATKLTKSEKTALHVAISSYHPNTKPSSSHEKSLTKMILVMKKRGTLSRVLAAQNERGDTPLHLAAAVGWSPIFDAIEEKDPHLLLHTRNKKGETPLFVAALHGNRKIFLRLHHKFHPDELLTRRKDGNTILHKAIFGEYFELAYMIIGYYPKLVNYINEDGESPLHVLAKKPNVFKSSSHLRLYDSVIYYCVFVDKLSIKKPRDSTDQLALETNDNYPENYKTCVKIFALVRSIGGRIYEICKKRPSCRADEENQHHQQNRSQSPGDSSPAQGTVRQDSSTAAAKETKGYRSYRDLFPANYVTCIDIFKFAMKVLLIILGVGFWRIKKIKEKKKRYLYAMEVLDEMLELELEYKYDNNGQSPPPKVSGKIDIPKAPPQFDLDDNYRDTTATAAATSSTEAPHPKNQKVDDQDKQRKAAFMRKDTPVLVAARTGILEMVMKIHRKCLTAIEDLDSEEKNVLMLAAEYRHTAVFDYLFESALPEYMFQQFDKAGNSILHLAAELRELQPWRIPGAALQMQWELKWYKHVKESLSSRSISHPNREGKTPRTIFTETHKELMKAGNQWLIKTSESCSVVAALIATVAFATSATVPGGLAENNGSPLLQKEEAFDIFGVASLVALCLSVMALVFFLAILTSRCEERDFKRNLPRKLLVGLSSLFASIAAILLSFCYGHSFILRKKLRVAAVPIYASATIPVAYFAVAQLPLYFDLLWATYKKLPLRSYKVFSY